MVLITRIDTLCSLFLWCWSLLITVVLWLHPPVLGLCLRLPRMLEIHLSLFRAEIFVHALLYSCCKNLANLLREPSLLAKVERSPSRVRILCHDNLAEDSVTKVNLDRQGRFLRERDIFNVDIVKYLGLRNLGSICYGRDLVWASRKQVPLILLGPEILIGPVQEQRLLLLVDAV